MRLEALHGDGATLRTHLTRLRAATGELDPRLAMSLRGVPQALGPLWETYVALANARQGEGGIAPSEIEAYARLHGLRLTPWEVDTLLAIDRTRQAVAAEQVDRNTHRST